MSTIPPKADISTRRFQWPSVAGCDRPRKGDRGPRDDFSRKFTKAITAALAWVGLFSRLGIEAGETRLATLDPITLGARQTKRAGSLIPLILEPLKIGIQRVFKAKAGERHAPLVPKTKIVIVLGCSSYGILLVLCFEALADIGVVGEFDAAMPNWLGDIRALIDQHRAISQISFVLSMQGHWLSGSACKLCVVSGPKHVKLYVV